MPRTTLETAALYAAAKEILRRIEDDAIPPGDYNVGDLTVTITLPPNTLVSRDKGPKGDGKKEVKATSNLYGFAAWALLLRRLASFNQAAAVKRMMLDALKDAITGNSTVEKSLTDIDPDFANEVEALRNTKLPTRSEDTTRNIKRPKDAVATLTVSQSLRQAS